MLGALQTSKYGVSSSSNFLANSTNVANALASISQNNVQATGQLAAQIASANQQKVRRRRSSTSCST